MLMVPFLWQAHTSIWSDSTKAQLAITEAIIAVSLLIFISYGVSLSVYSTSTRSPSEVYATFFYDFFQTVYGDKTFGACLADANESCSGMLEEFADTYGLRYIEIDTGSNKTTYGSVWEIYFAERAARIENVFLIFVYCTWRIRARRIAYLGNALVVRAYGLLYRCDFAAVYLWSVVIPQHII